MTTVAAAAHVRRNPLALVEEFHRTRRDPRLDLVPREAIRHRVVMPLDLDMIIETGTPDPPLGEDV